MILARVSKRVIRMNFKDFPKFVQGLIFCSIGQTYFACIPAYVPNAVNTPMFSQRNEVHVSGLWRGSNDWDLQSAYSVSPHFGVMANGNFASIRKNAEDYTYKRRFGELGAGFFNSSKPFNYEVYAGFGTGKTISKDNLSFFGSSNIVTSEYFNRYFIQGSLGVASGRMGPSMTSRFVYVDYYKFKIQDASSRHHLSKFFWEPALTIKLGPAPLKFVAQTIWVLPLSKNSELGYAKWQILLGAEMQLGR
jgi:hypothetical protein